MGDVACVVCLVEGGSSLLSRQRGVVVVPVWRWHGCCAGVRGSVEVLVGVGRPRGSGGVADSGESLAGASWPAAAALVGVAFFLGGAVVVICASSSLGSRSPGESQDPCWIRRRHRLQRRFPSWGVPSWRSWSLLCFLQAGRARHRGRQVPGRR